MPNVMKKVASALGVELGERFRIQKNGEVFDDDYVLHENGLFLISEEKERLIDDWLEIILTGRAEIVKPARRMMLGKGKRYYYLSSVGGVWHICSSLWVGDSVDISSFAMGNCFLSREEAEAHRGRVIELYQSVLEELE